MPLISLENKIGKTALLCKRICIVRKQKGEQSYWVIEKLILRTKHYFALPCLKLLLEVSFIFSVRQIWKEFAMQTFFLLPLSVLGCCAVPGFCWVCTNKILDYDICLTWFNLFYYSIVFQRLGIHVVNSTFKSSVGYKCISQVLVAIQAQNIGSKT